MNKINGNYEEVMNFVFNLKEKAYEETKGLNFKDYLTYIEKDIEDIKRKLKEKVSLNK